jgi:hypothetical protein
MIINSSGSASGSGYDSGNSDDQDVHYEDILGKTNGVGYGYHKEISSADSLSNPFGSNYYDSLEGHYNTWLEWWLTLN